MFFFYVSTMYSVSEKKFVFYAGIFDHMYFSHKGKTRYHGLL